jgi:polyhydroxybutyrate depolymerase
LSRRISPRALFLLGSLALALSTCGEGAGSPGVGTGGTGGGSGGSGGAGTGGRGGSGSGGTGGSTATGGSSGSGGGGGSTAGTTGGAGSGGGGGSAGSTGGTAGSGTGGTGGSASDAPPAETGARDVAAEGPSTGEGDRSAGCAVMDGLPEGDSTLMVGGASRSFRLRLPAGYTNTKAWPLVLALHPNGGSGIGYWDGTGRNIRQVVRDKAVLVLPLARGGNGDWDWRGDLPADNAYFEALLTRLKDRLCIDTRRIFAMGFSGGGSYAGVLGCLRKDIRAIATGGAVIYFQPNSCTNRPAAWVTIGNGELIAGRTMFRDHFRSGAGCQASSTPATPAGCVAYESCPAETPVQFCSHPGGHEWPGFGTQAAWDFFAKF